VSKQFFAFVSHRTPLVLRIYYYPEPRDYLSTVASSYRFLGAYCVNNNIIWGGKIHHIYRWNVSIDRHEHIRSRLILPVCFASKNHNALHIALLAWRYDTILSQPGAAREYIFMHYDQLICRPNDSHYRWKAHQTARVSNCSDTDYIYLITLDIDDHVGHRQCPMSLLWHNVWLLQYLPSSTKLTLCISIGRMSIGRSIAYWKWKSTAIFDEVCCQHVRLRQIDAMHRQEVQRSSHSPIGYQCQWYLPYLHLQHHKHCRAKSILLGLVWVRWRPNLSMSNIQINCHHQTLLLNVVKSSSSPPPTPLTQERGERGAETKSMTVVSASSSSAAPLTLSSRLHTTQARTGAVPTQSVSMPHTANQPPEDASPRRREKSSYAPSLPTHPKEGRGNSSQD